MYFNICLDALVFCFRLMHLEIEGREMLKQKEMQEPSNGDYQGFGLSDLSESEIKWVQLHQMFDR